MGLTLLDGPVDSRSGLYIGVLGFQGVKPLFRPIVLAQAVSSLPGEPDIYDAVHSLKKSLMKQTRYTYSFQTAF